MKASIAEKLQRLSERYEEVSALLSDAQVIAEQDRFRALSREYAELEEVVQVYREYRQALDTIEAARSLLEESDAEMRELAQEEITSAEESRETLAHQLQLLLLPRDPDDNKNVFLEVRAGTGGDEAALFAGDLFRMYCRYGEQRGWKVEILSENPGEHGGYKEIISRVSGTNVYATLKFESGAHRVQRVPETESQGRIHTSACTVAVMAEPDEMEEVAINKADIRVDTFRSSGAGGQHVNTTDSAIRITHLPTGIVVECQDERSQHKNRARAMSLLTARLKSAHEASAAQSVADQRRDLVGSGDRSERIRTYNFPQGRVTDHRINLTLYKLAEIIEGNMEEVLTALSHEYQADQLAALAD